MAANLALQYGSISYVCFSQWKVQFWLESAPLLLFQRTFGDQVICRYYPRPQDIVISQAMCVDILRDLLEIQQDVIKTNKSGRLSVNLTKINNDIFYEDLADLHKKPSIPPYSLLPVSLRRFCLN